MVGSYQNPSGWERCAMSHRCQLPSAAPMPPRAGRRHILPPSPAKSKPCRVQPGDTGGKNSASAHSNREEPR